MKTIYKYPVKPDADGRVEIEMPTGSRICHFGEQRGELFVWAIVGDGVPRVRTYRLLETGHEIPPNTGKFVGTAMSQGGVSVRHLFEAA